jgi:hypothetical protein
MEELHTFELRSPTAWSTTASATTANGLIDRLRELLASPAGIGTFAVVFGAPVAPGVKEQVIAVLVERIRTEEALFEDDVAWIDDLVDETGWEGARAEIDSALAPMLAGHPDDSDHRHSAFWADERTFVHLELDGLLWSWGSSSPWTQPWVSVSHWHPGSMTSGSWSDDVFAIDAGDGPVALLEVRSKDEDGNYWTIRPRPADAADAARTVAAFLSGCALSGAENQLLALVAHGFPVDGSADAFPVGLVAETWNERYEISGLLVAPPDDVLYELRRLGKLEPEDARSLRDRITTAVTELYELESVEDLSTGWEHLVAQLDEVSR